MIIVEVVIVVHVRLDRVQIDVHVLELPHKVEARGHALPAGDGVALVGRGSHQLETLLSDFKVLS